MATGKVGEEYVLRWLKTRPQIAGIIDFRKTRIVHECDIDCGVKLYQGQILLLEIKTDTHLGNGRRNILCEVLRINHTCHPANAGYLGWTLRSPAKYLAMYAPNWTDANSGEPHEAIYWAKFDDVRKTLQRVLHRSPIRQFTEVRTDRIKTTYNLLIPEKEFDGVFTIYKTNRL
jgi:hypothetical protein